MGTRIKNLAINLGSCRVDGHRVNGVPEVHPGQKWKIEKCKIEINLRTAMRTNSVDKIEEMQGKIDFGILNSGLFIFVKTMYLRLGLVKLVTALVLTCNSMLTMS